MEGVSSFCSSFTVVAVAVEFLRLNFVVVRRVVVDEVLTNSYLVVLFGLADVGSIVSVSGGFLLISITVGWCW